MPASPRSRALRGAIVAIVWLALIEVVAVAARAPDSGVDNLAWLSLGTIGLLSGVCALPALLLAFPLAGATTRAGMWLDTRPRLRASVGSGALAAAAALHGVNATVLVRLYASYHVMLSVLEVLLAMLGGFALAGMFNSATWPRRLGKGVRYTIVAAAALLCWLAAFMSLRSPSLRVLALERTTYLSQAVLIGSSFGSHGSGPEGPTAAASATLPRASSDSSEFRPMNDPAGTLRGSNVLLLTVDSMRADRFPGAPHAIDAPTMSSLAKAGTLFRRAYAPGCWTVHSMSSMLTSRLPSQLQFDYVAVAEGWKFYKVPYSSPLLRNPTERGRFTHAPVDDRSPTLAGILRRAGYQTATVVQYALYLRDGGITKEFEFVDDEDMRSKPVDGMGVAPVPMTQRATAWLDGRDPSKPFFLWVHYMDPHAPYEARDEASVGGSAAQRYDSELRAVDRELGKMVEALRHRGVLDDTIVVVHGDHGEEFGDHGGTFHATSLYEEVVHVPFLIAAPARSGFLRQSEAEAVVSLLDLTPTLLDLLGIASPAPMMGRSLRGVLEGKPTERRPVLFECATHGRDRRGVLDWPYKLVTDTSVGTAELYDLEKDPAERVNRLDREQAVARRLQTLLDGVPKGRVTATPPP